MHWQQQPRQLREISKQPMVSAVAVQHYPAHQANLHFLTHAQRKQAVMQEEQPPLPDPICMMAATPAAHSAFSPLLLPAGTYIQLLLSCATSGLVLSDELKHRQRVLRRLGYVDAEGLISVKGRVAADLQTGDELVLTELLFNGTFNSLTPEQAAALCSCFVWQEKSEAGVR